MMNEKLTICKNFDSKRFVSEEMLNQCDEKTKIRVSPFEDEDDSTCTCVGPFMYDLFEKQLFTDVTFHCNDKSTVCAHRAVLAAKCHFFNNLLFGETTHEVIGMEMKVQIGNVPFSIFTNILRYFYTDRIEFTDDCTVLEIYSAAQSFQIQHLIDRCKIYVESIKLTEDNVCSTLQACSNKHIEELKRRCINYIEKNTFQVISSTSFEKCSFSTVRDICDFQCLNLSSEAELLEAVLRWVNVQPKHIKKDIVRSLLKCIRFLSFAPKEFSDFMLRHSNLLTPEEGLKILIYLNNPTPESLKTLPKWCNINRRSFKVNHKAIPNDALHQCSRGENIKISLKPTNEQRDFFALTSIIHIRCHQDAIQIKSLKFCFEDIKRDGRLLAVLAIKVRVSPSGPTFHKNHPVNSEESTLLFEKSVKVFRGQTLQVEVDAEISQSCKFLQFSGWHKDPNRDFQCFFISKPKRGELYFISEVEYESEQFRDWF